ncbi:MAG: hypothetical protein HW421_2692 [Ignavibacteria bacterium]|nr:hypothetical protein [Ignavibacteria bacterium]
MKIIFKLSLPVLLLAMNIFQLNASCTFSSANAESFETISISRFLILNELPFIPSYYDSELEIPLLTGTSNSFHAVTGASYILGQGMNYNDNNFLRVFIDFNRDGDFSDPGEMVCSSGLTPTADHVYDGMINIPDSVTPGIYILRFTSGRSLDSGITGGCGFGGNRAGCVDARAFISRSNPDHWTKRNINSQNNLQSVFFVNASIGWVCGANGAIFKTTDGGQNWTSQSSSTFNFSSVFFKSPSIGFVLSENGYLLKTTNGGQSWSTSLLQSNPLKTKSMYFSPDSLGWIPDVGKFYWTTDDGSSWNTTNYSQSSASINSIFFLDSAFGWMAGKGGIIKRTTDARTNTDWDNVSSPLLNNINGIHFWDSLSGIAVGSEGLVLMTTSGGTTWTNYEIPGFDAKSLSFGNPYNGWAAGRNGKIYSTTSGNNSWNPVSSGSTEDLNSIKFVDAFSGWAVGDNGTVLKYRYSYPDTSAISCSVQPTIYCQGDSMEIYYSLSSTFGTSNTFVVQISDASGSFGAQPYIIGSIADSGSGKFSFNIPMEFPFGYGYRVRLISTSPIKIGDNNGTDIKIYRRPNPAITGNTVVCTGTSEKYSATISSDVSQTWSVTGATIIGSSNSGTVTLNFTKAGTAVLYIVQANSVTGCSKSISENIRVEETPQAQFNAPLSVCNKTIQYYTTNTIANSSNLWEVTGGGTILSSSIGTTVSVYWNNTGNSKIKLTQSINGTTCSHSTSKDILVTPAPQALITGSPSAYINEPEEFTASTSTLPITSIWRAVGASPETFTGNIFNVTWTSEGTKTLTLIQTVGVTLCKDTISKIIQVTKPEVLAVFGDATVCEKTVTGYWARKQKDRINKWSVFGGSMIGNPSDDSIGVNWFGKGMGWVKIEKTNQAAGTKESASISVTILSKPIVNFNGKLSVKSYETAIYTAASSGTGTLFEWTTTGGSVIGSTTENSIKIIWDEIGPANLKLTMTNTATGCSDFKAKTIDIVTNVDETAYPNSFFSLYPIPADNFIEIKSEKEFFEPIQIVITNIFGINVKEHNLDGLAAKNPVKVDLTSITPGVYFLNITTKEGRFKEKIIIMR